ncbi:[histone H3]-trimethyl-L-lysine4 demethylase [Geosmithia morbida]|uniref:[histone H3]-trimethyl-L-lysine4 demethylase n=1 Tax=Geosmithia morbida TaxID=1094350 RepID=A0A9P5D3P9_9HYPO|nr:[histone H3]-trimethyl-L-lysine4 demethylase [Geosmithia morbida]KAF4125192.1 [histone H3]-trimethyl-L-lysine4 demethylase [Geosmithia morbida]
MADDGMASGGAFAGEVARQRDIGQAGTIRNVAHRQEDPQQRVGGTAGLGSPDPAPPETAAEPSAGDQNPVVAAGSDGPLDSRITGDEPTALGAGTCAPPATAEEACRADRTHDSTAPEAEPSPSGPEESATPSQPPASAQGGDGNEAPASAGGLEYERDDSSSGILRLKPTLSQWEDFPAVLRTARGLGAEEDGCFKVVLPPGLLGPLPPKTAQTVAANAFRTRLMERTRIWQVSTVPTQARFPARPAEGEGGDGAHPEFEGDTDSAFARLRTLFNKSKNKQVREVRYRVDVPAWSAEQRLTAGVPARSPIHPLRGDRLDRTRAVIPGIHTPYVYESGAAFGAPFQLHAEDFRLSSLNHLYRGRKVWVVVPPSAVEHAEERLGRRSGCSQFMRHRAHFLFPTKLDRLAIPYRVVDQRAGETVVVLPDAYHQGFSTGYTLAEAKNYAEPGWEPGALSYTPCDPSSCDLPSAIPAALMDLLGEEEGEADRLDLCALQDQQDRSRCGQGEEERDRERERDLDTVFRKKPRGLDEGEGGEAESEMDSRKRPRLMSMASV